MKKHILLNTFLFFGTSIASWAQDVLVIEMNDNTTEKIKLEDIRQMTYQTTFSCADSNHPHMIDLGLPSGTKWACCNIGANSPEEYGGYYAWGETEEKSYFDRGTYTYFDRYSNSYIHIGDDIAGSHYDVAHVKWGGSWRMPSIDQIKELYDNCSWVWINQNGVNGHLVMGPNGGTIFVPAAGWLQYDDNFSEGTSGIYWTSSLYMPGYESLAVYLYFNSDYWNYESDERYNGCTVRAVIIPEKEKPTDESPVAEAIDLGLPSGTKWASWNIGASAPEECGGYYAWGETEEKDFYDWGTYAHCDDSIESYHYISDNIAGTEYDVAHVKWGGSWRMPSYEQINELSEKCSWTWVTQNGVNGVLVTGPNGSTIFLPAAGMRWDDRLEGVGEEGYLWSSSLDPYNVHPNHYILLDSYCGLGSRPGYIGFSVRAVCP